VYQLIAYDQRGPRRELLADDGYDVRTMADAAAAIAAEPCARAD
jgi:hypothetical protein